jgi:hypothetical protein
MKLFAKALITLMLLLVPCQTVLAQTAMPQPGLVVLDTYGTVVGQVAGFQTVAADIHPFVVLKVDGKLAYLFFRSYGLIDRKASLGSATGGATVYFSSTSCTGDAYVNGVGETSLEGLSGNSYGVAGPIPPWGEYVLYRSTTLTVATVPLYSRWEGGACINYSSPPHNKGVLTAEEVDPNPLGAYLGPFLTIAGGDSPPTIVVP